MCNNEPVYSNSTLHFIVLYCSNYSFYLFLIKLKNFNQKVETRFIKYEWNLVFGEYCKNFIEKVLSS